MKDPIDFLLSAELDELPLEFVVSSLSRGLIILRMNKIKELGISFPQNYRFLEILKEENDNQVIQKDFAEIFRINQSTVTRSLNSLEEEGFIERITLKDNRKNKIIKLTDKGNDTIKEIEDYDKKIENELLKSITEDEAIKFKEMNIKFTKIIHQLIKDEM